MGWETGYLAAVAEAAALRWEDAAEEIATMAEEFADELDPPFILPVDQRDWFKDQQLHALAAKPARSERYGVVSSTYTADGRRRSSMTHASWGHECSICHQVSFGNGGEVSHGRAHVRRGEAVELVKNYATQPSSRVFLAVDDDQIAQYRARGFREVES
ncbi:hypothetical protein ACFV9C_41815 [Kribbella sp. NPDC059898]|uniref:hypothetical protein n=1 Tax=Kribbella sp. NPDC059898 TaxID=3346995 RepID=UPI003660118D